MKRTALILVAAVALATAGGGALAAPPPTPHVWLHYDYLVYPDGHSDAPDPTAIQKVVDVFAAHGIVLEIDNHHTAVPTSNPLLILGVTGGCGALGLYDVKAQYFHPTSNHEWHYALFGDTVVTPVSWCPKNTSGTAEINGDNFVVSMNQARRWGPNAAQAVAGFFMHELGHNLGLLHGGNEDVNYKPNYLSVMNYQFNLFGIPNFQGYDLDYSESALPTLDLAHLDETIGIQGDPRSPDYTRFELTVIPGNPTFFISGSGPVHGPIDWNHDGNATENDVAVGMVDPDCGCLLPEFLTGFDDWRHLRSYILGTIVHGPKAIAHETAAEQPAVSRISTAAGPANGGTSVTITGDHLGKATQVLFGTTRAASFTIVGQRMITAVSPPTPSVVGGAVDVTVVSGDNPSPSVPADVFTYDAWQPPVVDSISPSAGLPGGGTTVTIRGSHLGGASAVFFDGPSSATFTVVDDNTIQAVSPTVPFVGWVDVRVTTLGGRSATVAGDRFTFAPPPTLQGIWPVRGSEEGGTTVTITLSLSDYGLLPITGVFFGAAPAAAFTQPVLGSVPVFPTITMTAAAPPGVGSVDVTVTNAVGTSAMVSTDLFGYVARPTVISVSPTSGLPGTTVTIRGNRFADATNVCFGGTCVGAAGFSVVDDGTITATVPASPLEGSTVDVTVTTPGGTSLTVPADLFTLL